MRKQHEQFNGVPRWSAPWAAGWSAMSDISRIEVDTDRENSHASPNAGKARRGARGFGLAAGALTAMVVAATVWL